MSDVSQYPRITFGIIVLNGEPFLRYNLRALYSFAHQIIVIEGACEAAASLSTYDGHSTDGTLEMLRQFKVEHDPVNKLIIVTGEDEGKPNGFWSEKDEMSQAYSRRATGDWLWQVDSDEFYLEKDIESILAMLVADPEIAGISFPYFQFWGGFDYLADGQLFRYDLPCFHRLFRWGKGYAYVSHRPPTVVNEQGRDLRSLKWIHYQRLRQRGIYLYHYSYVLPKQAEQKVGYYTYINWSDAFRDNERWLNERYLQLKNPYHIAEEAYHFTWLVRHRGVHPSVISELRHDIAAKRISVRLRQKQDIEQLLQSPGYILGRWILGLLLAARWFLFYKHARAIKAFARKAVRKKGERVA